MSTSDEHRALILQAAWGTLVTGEKVPVPEVGEGVELWPDVAVAAAIAAGEISDTAGWLVLTIGDRRVYLTAPGLRRWRPDEEPAALLDRIFGAGNRPVVDGERADDRRILNVLHKAREMAVDEGRSVPLDFLDVLVVSDTKWMECIAQGEVDGPPGGVELTGDDGRTVWIRAGYLSWGAP